MENLSLSIQKGVAQTSLGDHPSLLIVFDYWPLNLNKEVAHKIYKYFSTKYADLVIRGPVQSHLFYKYKEYDHVFLTLHDIKALVLEIYNIKPDDKDHILDFDIMSRCLDMMLSKDSNTIKLGESILFDKYYGLSVNQLSKIDKAIFREICIYFGDMSVMSYLYNFTLSDNDLNMYIVSDFRNFNTPDSELNKIRERTKIIANKLIDYSLGKYL